MFLILVTIEKKIKDRERERSYQTKSYSDDFCYYRDSEGSNEFRYRKFRENFTKPSLSAAFRRKTDVERKKKNVLSGPNYSIEEDVCREE